MIRAAIKETVVDLAMSGLERVVLNWIEKNPYSRMHQVSENVFGFIDHKQMLASVVVKHLVDDNKVVKYRPIKHNKNGTIQRTIDGEPILYSHFVYVAK